MSAILNSLNGHNFFIFQPILITHVSKFMVYRALFDKTYLILGLRSPLTPSNQAFPGIPFLNIWVSILMRLQRVSVRFNKPFLVTPIPLFAASLTVSTILFSDRLSSWFYIEAKFPRKLYLLFCSQTGFLPGFTSRLNFPGNPIHNGRFGTRCNSAAFLSDIAPFLTAVTAFSSCSVEY